MFKRKAARVERQDPPNRWQIFTTWKNAEGNPVEFTLDFDDYLGDLSHLVDSVADGMRRGGYTIEVREIRDAVTLR